MTTDLAIDQAGSDDVELAERMKRGRDRILRELRKLIVGQDDIIEQVLISLFVGGNSIITGVPGLAKTLIVHTLAQVLDLKFSRIQFTPDLMPSDITGTDIIQEDPETGRRHLVFVPGPVFSHIVLSVGVTGADNNFGELPPASLAGFVYADTNNNGVFESTETGITGVSVALSGPKT